MSASRSRSFRRDPFRGLGRACVLLVITGCAWSAQADEGPATAGESRWDSNVELMFHRDEPRNFARTFLEFDDYLDSNDGLFTQLGTTLFYQHASDSLTDRNDELNLVFDFGGAWEPRFGSGANRGALTWWVRGGRPVGDPRDSDLSKDIGSLLGINDSRDDKELYVRELFWVQQLSKGFGFTIGQVDATYRYDFNAVANDERYYFIAAPLNNSQSIPFPDPSPSADILWSITDGALFRAGIYSTVCEKGSWCLDKLESDKWFSPAELTVSPFFDGLGQGNYRFLAYYTETGEQKGGGWSMSFDQQIGRFTPFMRLSSGDKEITAIERFFSLGVGLDKPFGRPWDQAGIGYSTGKPSDPLLRDETLIELYWRFQLNPFVAVTPDLQWVIDPAENPVDDRIFVAGLRLQLDF
jgi:porin